MILIPKTICVRIAVGLRSFSSGKAKRRVPLIKFVGKRSLLAKNKSSGPPVVLNVDRKLVYSSGNGLNFFDVVGGEWFGRPILSDTEIEAIETGGASAYS